MQATYLTPAYLTAVQKGDTQGITVQSISASGIAGPFLEVTDGTITFDYTAATRGSINLTISDPTRTLVPAIATDTLAPYGQKLAVYMGPVTTTMVPMGVYEIQEVDADDQGTQFFVTVKGADLSARISRETLTAVYDIPAGTNYATAIQNLIANRLSGFAFNFSFTSYTTPHIILDVNQDPWAAALQMATSIGMDLFFDRVGVCTLRPTPDPSTVAPSWIYSDTELGFGHMLDHMQKAMVGDGTVYNHVIVTGEASGTTTIYTASASDTNTLSPTWVGGPFGDIPIFFKSSIINSTPQAQALANAKLIYYIGRGEQVTIQGPPNPAQEVEDVVRVVRSALSIDSYYTIDKCVFAIAPAGQNTTSSGSSSASASSGQQTLTMRKVIPGL